MPKLDPVLDAWLFDEPGAADGQAPAASSPQAVPETRLLSATAPGGTGQARVDAAVLTGASGALEQIRQAVFDDRAAALLVTGDNGDRTLALHAELGHVADRWREKFDHLDSEMAKQVKAIGDAGRNWTAADDANANTYKAPVTT